jgi:hypothetical protein
VILVTLLARILGCPDQEKRLNTLVELVANKQLLHSLEVMYLVDE